MKTIRLYFSLFALCCFPSLYARAELGSGLLFPQFETGTVVFKNGGRSSASLNYNMIQQEMVFLDADGSIMAIDNPLEISVVLIGERRFFPVSSLGVFYEAIPAGKNSFFVRHRAIRVSKGKAAAYGGYDPISSATSYGSYQDNTGHTVKLNPDEKFQLRTERIYYLKPGNSYKSFASAKTLGKLFKGHEAKIKEFADKESINFSKTEDVARIVEYGYSLK